MDVTVTGMTEIDNRYVIPLLDLFNDPDYLRYLGAGDDDVLIKLVRIHIAQ